MPDTTTTAHPEVTVQGLNAPVRTRKSAEKKVEPVVVGPPPEVEGKRARRPFRQPTSRSISNPTHSALATKTRSYKDALTGSSAASRVPEKASGLSPRVPAVRAPAPAASRKTAAGGGLGVSAGVSKHARPRNVGKQASQTASLRKEGSSARKLADTEPTSEAPGTNVASDLPKGVAKAFVKAKASKKEDGASKPRKESAVYSSDEIRFLDGFIGEHHQNGEKIDWRWIEREHASRFPDAIRTYQSLHAQWRKLSRADIEGGGSEEAQSKRPFSLGEKQGRAKSKGKALTEPNPYHLPRNEDDEGREEAQPKRPEVKRKGKALVEPDLGGVVDGTNKRYTKEQEDWILSYVIEKFDAEGLPREWKKVAFSYKAEFSQWRKPNMLQQKHDDLRKREDTTQLPAAASQGDVKNPKKRHAPTQTSAQPRKVARLKEPAAPVRKRSCKDDNDREVTSAGSASRVKVDREFVQEEKVWITDKVVQENVLKRPGRRGSIGLGLTPALVLGLVGSRVEMHCTPSGSLDGPRS